MSEIELSVLKGLSENVAAERLSRDGYNEIASVQRRGYLKIIFEVFREPMFLLLVACGVIYLILGDKEEAAMLLSFVFVIMGITIYQEGKTERAIEALRDLSSPRALVIRDGVQKRIPGREVVRDDIIIVREGDRIPADAVLLWGINLKVDESLLTGESVAVRKIPDASADTQRCAPGGDDLPYVFSGTLVVQGQGVARVSAVGARSRLGAIGKILGFISDEQTVLQKSLGKLVKSIFAAAVFLCAAVVAVYGLTRGDWMQAVLSGITLAMAMLPEEFPVVLTIFLALGAWRISRKGVLTRKVAAVETLGAARVLCVDKTGTLTQNKMSIRKLFHEGVFFDVPYGRHAALPEAFHELIEYGVLASKKDPFDPMEKALEELGHKMLHNTEHIHKDWPLVEEYPLSREIMALSHVWETPDGTGFVVSAKGAPEAVADLCHLGDIEKDALRRCIDTMAREGLRVLGVAKAQFGKQELPKSQHDFDFQFIGLIGLADPVRPGVPDAIKECYDAGIRVVMMTGDYPSTAQNIAVQIGLRNPGAFIVGAQLEKMTFAELCEQIRTVNIFSRVAPEQKLLIVNALKADAEVVAMTGDGVNDAPALKAAHIGIAMGGRGTDVARESADLVLVDDDFSSIVDAVRMGRRIYDNLRKAMAYIIGVHVPIAGLSLIPVLIGWPIVLYPAHIVVLELIIDPACSVVFEAEAAEKNVMSRPPRSPEEPLFGRRLLLLSVMQGLFSLAVVLAVFHIALVLHQGESGARTLAFLTLVVSNVCLILTNRSWSRSIVGSFSNPNRSLLAVLAGVAVFFLCVIYSPFLRKLFHFGWMHPIDLLICLAAGILSVVWFEFAKFLFNKNQIDLLKS